MMPTARILTHNDRAYRREKIVSAYCGGSCPITLAQVFAISREHVRRVLRDCHSLQHSLGEVSFWEGANVDDLIAEFCKASPKAAEIRRIQAERAA